MYFILQAVNIWGMLLIDPLIKWGFKKSCTDKRFLFLRTDLKFGVGSIEVYDMGLE